MAEDNRIIEINPFTRKDEIMSGELNFIKPMCSVNNNIQNSRSEVINSFGKLCFMAFYCLR